MKKLTRRTFIKGTTIGTVGIGLPLATAEYLTPNSNKNHKKDMFHFERDIPIEDEFDIVVVGGGPSGTSAAISAARLGARILLVEATGCLGGMGTSGLVNGFPSIGDGKEIIAGGIFLEVATKLFERGFLNPDERPEFFHKYDYWIHFNTEGYKMILDEMVNKAGVNVRFFTKLIDVDSDIPNRRINGIVVQNIEGYKYIKAKAFIDCTGDAFLADISGVACIEAGRDTPHIMPPSLLSSFANINYANAVDGGSNSKYLLQAIKDGHFTQPDYHLTGIYRSGKTIGNLNGGHLFDLNALRCADLTDGMIRGRKIAHELFTYYKKYVPGFENIEHVATASLLGIRESRRIIGEYKLSFEDFKAKREFPDQIGIFQYPVDIHPYVNTEEALKEHKNEFDFSGRLNPGEHFGIPYSIIVPRGWSNLWVAGRSNSSDTYVSSSIRVQTSCYLMGQAAGTASVQSINTGQPANQINTKQLIKTLRSEGAILPQKNLSDTMTRI
jgi:hypothetical protein